MSREWKPGDVALVTGYGAGRRAVFVASNCDIRGHQWANSGHWHYLDDIESTTWTSNPNVEAHPLVVIDAEDREQVERLLVSYCDEYGDGTTYQPDGKHMRATDAMQAALREFADPKPPRPEEPTNWLAVVKDDRDTEWYRWSIAPSHADRAWLSAWDTERKNPTGWSEINVAEVLSEGWSE